MSESTGVADRPGRQEGWKWRPLREIAAVIRGVTYKKDQVGVPDAPDHIPLLRATNIATTGLLLRDFVWIPRALVKEPQMLHAGDLVVAASSGSLSVVGKAAQVEGSFNGTFGAFCAVVRPDISAVDPRFLRWFMASDYYRRRVSALAAGSNINNLKREHLLEMPIPVPPLDEQQHIVETVEQRVAEIGHGSALLREMTFQLQGFHASLLEATCLGTLLNPARCRPVSADGPSPLPAGWEWKTLGELAADEPRAISDGPFGSNLKSSHYTNNGPRVIRLQNVGEGTFLDAAAHISQAHFRALQSYEAKPGDVVLASLGSELPRACVVPDWLGPAIVKADCPRIRPAPSVNPHFLAACLNSRPVRRQAAAVVHGVGRPRLKLADARKLKLPLPPREEQDAIVVRLKELKSGALVLEQARDEALTQAQLAQTALLRDAMLGTLSHSVGNTTLSASDAPT